MKTKINGVKPEFSDYQLNRIIEVFEKKYSKLNSQAVKLQSKKNLSAQENNFLALVNNNLESMADLIYIAQCLRDYSY